MECPHGTNLNHSTQHEKRWGTCRVYVQMNRAQLSWLQRARAHAPAHQIEGAHEPVGLGGGGSCPTGSGGSNPCTRSLGPTACRRFGRRPAARKKMQSHSAAPAGAAEEELWCIGNFGAVAAGSSPLAGETAARGSILSVYPVHQVAMHMHCYHGCIRACRVCGRPYFAAHPHRWPCPPALLLMLTRDRWPQTL